MKNLEQQVREHYQSQSLSPDRIDAIVNRGNQTIQRRMTLYASAAALLLAVLGTVFLTHDSAHALRYEAAVNHTLELKMDFAMSDINELKLAMNKLPFKPELPSSLSIDESRLIGARYCTVNGKIAAHVKLRGINQANDASLFMAKANTELDNFRKSSAILHNVSVNTWQENGIFYVLAETIPDIATQ